MKIIETSIAEVVIIEPHLFKDKRGYFFESFSQREFETKVLGQQKHDSSVIPFERGKIYDRNGNILATNEKIYTLVLEPKNILLRKKKYEATTINALHEYFGFSKKNLKKVIEGNKDSYYVVYKRI